MKAYKTNMEIMSDIYTITRTIKIAIALIAILIAVFIWNSCSPTMLTDGTTLPEYKAALIWVEEERLRELRQEKENYENTH